MRVRTYLESLQINAENVVVLEGYESDSDAVIGRANSTVTRNNDQTTNHLHTKRLHAKAIEFPKDEGLGSDVFIRLPHINCRAYDDTDSLSINENDEFVAVCYDEDTDLDVFIALPKVSLVEKDKINHVIHSKLLEPRTTYILDRGDIYSDSDTVIEIALHLHPFLDKIDFLRSVAEKTDDKTVHLQFAKDSIKFSIGTPLFNA